MEQFGDYAYYYNAFYKDKDYRKEAEDVDTLLRKYGHNIKDIIVYGCGTGRHDVELVKMGYTVHGIDMSPQMIDMAKKNADEQRLDITYEVADIRSYKPKKKYDAVISLFHVMSYQNTNEDIKSAFTSARSALGQGGVFLFDAWYGPGVLTDPPAVRIKEVEDDQYRFARLCRPEMHDETNIVDVHYEIMVIDKDNNQVRTINETHRMRYLFRPEVEELLQTVGFDLMDHVDCNTLQRTDYTSWTCYFVTGAKEL